MNLEAPCVITGQQIGLLGGALYTPFKVLGALALAKDLGGKAVYWLETHDADAEEISHLDFINADKDLERLTWKVATGGATSGSLLVDEALRRVLETYFDRLPQTPETPTLKELALSSYELGIRLGEASLKLAENLFGPTGISLFRPDQTSFRLFAQPFLHRDLERTPEGEQATVFLLDHRRGKSIRRALFRKSGKWLTREGESLDPEKFVLLPSVRNRSIVQDAFFNAHSYVAGPGEVKYLGTMAEDYAFHGVQAARVVPRMSATLLDHRDQKLLSQTNLTLSEVLHTPLTRLLKKALSQGSCFDFEKTEIALRSLKDRVAREVSQLGLDPTPVEGPLYTGIKESLGRRRAKEKARHRELLSRVSEISNRLFPMGKPQERVRGLFEFMNLHGGLSFVNTLRQLHDFSATVLEIP